MNKKRSIDFILIIFILGLLLIFGGCSKSPERRKTWTTTSDSLPKKPTQGQIFRDRDNNSWAYNAALGAWVLGSGGYRYYPETNSYTLSLRHRCPSLYRSRPLGAICGKGRRRGILLRATESAVLWRLFWLRGRPPSLSCWRNTSAGPSLSYLAWKCRWTIWR